MEKYNLNPNEIFCIKTILLAKDNEKEPLQKYVQVLNGQFRVLLETLKSKGIILKSYNLPKEGTIFHPEDVTFNQNFLKTFYRSAFEMGEELFYTYPLNCVVNGTIYNLRSVSKRFDSLEQAFQRYAKAIKNNPDLHEQIIDNIKWGIETNYSGFTTLDRFIIDRGWESLDSIRNGEGSNLNLEATQLI